jgi:hypothetical protein
MFRHGLVLAAVASSAWAQATAAANDRLTVLLREPFGAPVADAAGSVWTRAPSMLQALADFAGGEALAFTRLAAQRQDGRSDSQGLLRFAPREGAANGCAGSGFVSTAAGLGALLFDVQPGRAQRVELQPMAALSTATQSESFVVYARATTIDGRTVTLPPQQGTTVRLPAGDYELWVHHADEGWLWERRTLASGQQVQLSFAAPAQRVQRAASTTVIHPSGRPDVPLFPPGGLLATLRGDARRAPCLGWNGGNDPTIHGPVPLPAAGDALAAWPPPRTEATTPWTLPAPDPLAAPQQAVFVLQHEASGAWRLLAAATPTATQGAGPANATYLLPPPPPGDVWLLFLAAGYAPQARPWAVPAETPPFTLQRGAALRLLATDDAGLPVGDLAVEYMPDGMPAATVAGHTDARGRLGFGPVLGPGLLRVTDPRFANLDLAVDRIPADGIAVTVLPGAVLQGRVQWPDGTPAASALVTLRDPSGKLQPAARHMLTDTEGGFHFGGLAEQRPVLVTATRLRGNHTFTARLPRALPGSDAVCLQLDDEDPSLLPVR